MSWTDRMYAALRERSRRLDPNNYPGNCPPDVAAWREEVDRVYDALEWLSLRKLFQGFERVKGELERSGA